MKKRLIVGLTGSFGSGKSTVGQIFKRLGARQVIDADKIAHEVFRSGHPLGKRIKKLFGVKGALDRKAIARKVFSDPLKRRRLEAIIHPYVFGRIRGEIAKIQSGIVILEVPLLFETGFDGFCDVTVVVLSKEKDVYRRLLKSGYPSREIRARLRSQMSARQKKAKADLLIDNSGSKSQLIQKTKLIWGKLKGF